MVKHVAAPSYFKPSASINSHITAQFYKITNHLCLNLIYLWFLEWTSDIDRKRPPPLTLDGSVLITVSLRWIPPMFELHRRLRSLKQSSLCSSNLYIKQYSLQTHVYPSIFFTIKFSIKSVAEFNKILKEYFFIITIISLSTYNWSFIVSIICRNSCGVKYGSTQQLAHTTGNVVIDLEKEMHKLF